MSMPLPNRTLTPIETLSPDNGELNDNEAAFILETTLSPKRRNDEIVLAFVESFVRCKNIKQASSECGIHHEVGYRIRHYKDVATAIDRIIAKSAVKYGFDASEIVERTKEMVDFDPIAVQNSDGTFISNLHAIAPEARRNIKKLKVKNLWGEHEDINGMKTKIVIGEVIEYEFYDKLKAIDLVGKEKELFKTVNKVEHTVSKDMASILLASVKRADDVKQTIQVKPRDVEVVIDEA